MCVDCIRSQVDITDGIPKQLILQWCRSCNRYYSPPNLWTPAELESKELLGVCLKRVKGLNKVKLIDAGFVWTEPHSRRLKVKLTVQQEVFQATILQQSFIIEYTVQNYQCDQCKKVEAQHTWTAIVQVRQRVDHKRTFFWLEQLILRHAAHQNTTNIKERADGLDFYYGHKNHAMKMVDFLMGVVPARKEMSERLISYDEKSDITVMKFSFSIEIVPVCRDDLVCLPKSLLRLFGSPAPLLLCTKVSTQLQLMDPFTLQTVDLRPEVFFQYPFRSLLNQKQLIEYTVLDVVETNHRWGKYAVAEITVARSTDFGKNDVQFTAKSHLGNILKPGDFALGYDLTTASFVDSDVESIKSLESLPDFVLVRKAYPERRKKHKQRHWRLRTLDKEAEEVSGKKTKEQQREEQDKEMFLRDLEEDPDLRAQIQLVKEKNAQQILTTRKNETEEEMIDEDFPEIELTELLEDMNINDNHQQQQ